MRDAPGARLPEIVSTYLVTSVAAVVPALVRARSGRVAVVEGDDAAARVHGGADDVAGVQDAVAVLVQRPVVAARRAVLDDHGAAGVQDRAAGPGLGRDETLV